MARIIVVLQDPRPEYMSVGEYYEVFLPNHNSPYMAAQVTVTRVSPGGGSTFMCYHKFKRFCAEGRFEYIDNIYSIPQS